MYLIPFAVSNTALLLPIGWWQCPQSLPDPTTQQWRCAPGGRLTSSGCGSGQGLTQIAKVGNNSVIKNKRLHRRGQSETESNLIIILNKQLKSIISPIHLIRSVLNLPRMAYCCCSRFTQQKTQILRLGLINYSMESNCIKKSESFLVDF